MPTKTDRVQIAYRLTFTTLFHCGTGMRSGLVDRTVIRDHDGYLYVPGSTFKGSLRERCEQLARFYESSEARKGLIASPHNTDIALHGPGRRQPTLVTRIFGSHTVAGRLFFDDATLVDQKQYERLQDEEDAGQAAALRSERRANRQDYKGLQVDLYTQVRLNRPTRTSVPGALYTSEFGARDLTFQGWIQGWLECVAIEDLCDERFPASSPTYSLLLLLAGLRMVERLGGNKSTGKGQCLCEIEQVKLNGHAFAQEEWLSWLEKLEQLTQYATTWED